MQIKPNSTFEINIYYKRSGLIYKAIGEKEFRKIEQKDKKKYSRLKVFVKQLTWGIYNELQNMMDENDEEFWNHKLYKETKMKKILVGWDAKKKNKDGTIENIPVNEEELLNLSPEIAEKILDEYDSQMSLTDLEEKKLAGKVHSFIMSHGKSSFGVSRDVIEGDLIDEFHWLPQEINEIPYKQLQKFLLIRRVKYEARKQRESLDAQSAKLNAGASKSSGRGQIKRR
jgi:hypothetical protein